MRNPLPSTTVQLTCNACRKVFAELDVNTLHLAGEIGKQRRQHAINEHNWSS